MTDIAQKLAKPGKSVVDTCAGAFFVSSACMLPNKHIKLVRCEVDPTCIVQVISQLPLLHTLYVLPEKSEADEEKMVAVLPMHNSRHWKRLR